MTSPGVDGIPLRAALVPEAGATGVGRAGGTFGELLQGVLPGDDLDFLVSLPIAAWSTATFSLDPESASVCVFPQRKAKALQLARIMLSHYGVAAGGTLELDTRIPEGKGLASSTADLVASARAIGRAIGVAPASDQIESFLRAIEPSDGVMHDGVVAFLHRDVRLREHLGWLPPLTIVGIDEGSEVDTIEFNRIEKPFTHADKLEYARLLAALTRAVRDGDLATVGEVATRSAIMNQRLRVNRTLPAMLRLRAECDALGLAIAHSGTYVGLLFDADGWDSAERVAGARGRCEALFGPASVSVFRSLTHDSAAALSPAANPG